MTRQKAYVDPMTSELYCANLLKLESIGSDLEGSQRNLNLAVLHRKLLSVVLEDIGLPNPLHIKGRLNDTLTSTTQTVIDAQDHALALPPLEFTTTDILIVLTSLNRIKNK